MTNQPFETVFTMEATPVKFGRGAAQEAGWEAARLGMRRVILITDPQVARLALVGNVAAQLRAAGLEVSVFDRSRVEPTLESLQEAVAFARAYDPDGFVSLGGGSSIDTAKVVNLLLTHGGEILDYVNTPVGAGRRPAGPLLPHLAIPTTAGSGSEATTVAVLDLPALKIKTGISHRYLRPSQAIVDPELTRTAPAAVIASAGLDVVCHAAESYLSRPFGTRPKPTTPDERPPYQGSNPVADVWSAQAIRFGGEFLRRAVADAGDLEARGLMMLAATMAGVGFGSAGVHIPHSCAYPIAGLKHDYQAEGYPSPFIPHGFSVIVTAPAAFRFTFDAMPQRHLQVAEWLTGGELENPGPDSLPNALIDLMRDVGAPSGLSELGYSEQDLPALIAGAVKQERLLAVAPKTPTETDLEAILRASFRNW